MTQLKVPYEGSSNLLDARKTYWNATPNSSNLRLYADSGYTFDPTDTLATLNAIQAVFDGYTPFQLDTWSSPAGPDGSGHMAIVEVLRTFICTGLTGLPVTIYGYYICDDNAGVLHWVQEAATPIVIATIGDFYAVIPKYTQKSEY